WVIVSSSGRAKVQVVPVDPADVGGRVRQWSAREPPPAPRLPGSGLLHRAFDPERRRADARVGIRRRIWTARAESPTAPVDPRRRILSEELNNGIDKYWIRVVTASVRDV